ncbi:MAG: hypothetical protein K2J82_01405 [Muribaculaceae bacterium]|nr:hypothetical protein [Muribaculaceae bacterium]
MEIKGIYPPNLYAIKYSGDKLNIYRLTLRNLTDTDYLEKFFSDFNTQISDFLIDELGYGRDEIEEYIIETNDQIIDIRDDLEKICKDIAAERTPNFGSYFKPHSKIDFGNPVYGGGVSKEYGIEYLPVKCYGTNRPPLVRIYAIELALDCYLIIYGAIKIQKSTEKSPAFDRRGNPTTIEEEIKKYVHKVCKFLKDNSIIDKQTLLDYMKEDDE